MPVWGKKKKKKKRREREKGRGEKTACKNHMHRRAEIIVFVSLILAISHSSKFILIKLCIQRIVVFLKASLISGQHILSE